MAEPEASRPVYERARPELTGAFDALDEDGKKKILSQTAEVLQDDKVFAGICTGMVACRQLYQSLLQSLRLRQEQEGLSDALGDYMVQCMAHRARQPFARAEVYRRAKNVILPLMIYEMQQEERRLQQRGQQRAIIAREHSGVSCGFRFGAGGVSAIQRGNTGWFLMNSSDRLQVRDFRNQLIGVLLDPQWQSWKSGCNVLVLTGVDLIGVAGPNISWVHPDAWRKASSWRKFIAGVDPRRRGMPGYRVDAVVVDYHSLRYGMSQVQHVDNVSFHRTVNKLLTYYQAACFAILPVSEADPLRDIPSNRFEIATVSLNEAVSSASEEPTWEIRHWNNGSPYKPVRFTATGEPKELLE